jgi:hypothetical protein
MEFPSISGVRTPVLNGLVDGPLANLKAKGTCCFGTDSIRLRYGVGTATVRLRWGYQRGTGARYGRPLVLGVGDGVEVLVVDHPALLQRPAASSIATIWLTGFPISRAKSSLGASTHLPSS